MENVSVTESAIWVPKDLISEPRCWFWTGAPCLRRRGRGTTWVNKTGRSPLPMLSIACSEAD